MHDISSLTNELEMCRRELDALKAKVKMSKMKQCMQEVEHKASATTMIVAACSLLDGTAHANNGAYEPMSPWCVHGTCPSKYIPPYVDQGACATFAGGTCMNKC